MSQSCLLPSWPPLRTCCENGPWKLHEEPAAFDRTDGRCYYCGKKADGMFAERPRGLRTNGKYPWAKWFDGAPHAVSFTGKWNHFRWAALRAAERHGVDITLKHTDDGAILQAHLLAKAAA